MAAPAAGAGAAAARKLAETAARIFGNVLGTGQRSGRKILNKPLIGDQVANYYGESLKASDPLFEDPLEKRCVPVRRARGACRSLVQGAHAQLCVRACRRKVKLERLKRRGKSPPKKGEGKRAGKR